MVSKVALAEGFNCISTLPSSIPVSFILDSPPGDIVQLIGLCFYLKFTFLVKSKLISAHNNNYSNNNDNSNNDNNISNNNNNNDNNNKHPFALTHSNMFLS